MEIFGGSQEVSICQRALTERISLGAVIEAFFEASLKQDESARERLRRAGLDFSEVTLTLEEWSPGS